LIARDGADGFAGLVVAAAIDACPRTKSINIVIQRIRPSRNAFMSRDGEDDLFARFVSEKRVSRAGPVMK
jgi:hypothetical protein